MNTELKENIFWVGFVDWNVRDFHGYTTDKGSSYNAYLIRDEKTALIDTVKGPYAGELLRRIEALVPYEKVDYIICNHAEPDHAGSLPKVVEACPNAVVVCDAKCEKALGLHFDTSEWTFKIVKEGDSLSLGKRTLQFIETPMVHWPESMFTYIPEEKLLFSMDAFGQHYATVNRFDDEANLNIVMDEARTYYANIVMLYGRQISKVLDRSSAIDIEMIAPSHGVIFRSHIDLIMEAYRNWVVCKALPKVVIFYDTMWKSTEKMAEAILHGVEEFNVDASLINVRASNITVLATEVLEAAVVAAGSPTLNTTLMPAMAGSLTYLKGLRPQDKKGFAFGSYGWAQGGAADVENYLKDMKFEILREPLLSKFVPTPEVIEECVEAGRMLAKEALKVVE
ncbi:MAG: FprA family A-type flavoprotein [Spartobacteria bacterium]|nr:FprA family A-type flavoprotein [Spartobacteria bacterium]